MSKLIALYFGTAFLAYLSQTYYPVSERNRANRRSFLRDKTDAFLIVMIIWMTLFNGLKTSYNDTANYISFYQNAPDTLSRFFSQSGGFDYTGNPMFYICQTIVKGVIDNYHVWFLLVAGFNAVIIVKIFKRYSENLAFSFVVFYSIGTYVMYVAAMKQSVAVAILMLAIPFLLEHRWVSYYLLVLLAIFFHTHAFLFLILPAFLEKPWGKMTYISLAAVLLAMATYDVLLGAFLRYAQSIGANVAENEVFDGHSLNVLRVLVYAVPTVISFAFRKRLFANSTTDENLFANMSILSTLILSIGLVEGGNLFARMAGYFEWSSAITLPWMVKKVFNQRSQRFVLIMASVLYFGYFLFEFTVSKDFGSDYAAITLWQFIRSLFS